MKKGTLYLIPTPINNSKACDVLLPKDLEIIRKLDTFFVETPKIARKFLKEIQTKTILQELEVYELSEHTRDRDLDDLSKILLSGKDVGLMSDAGIPAIADPGYRFVIKAKLQNIPVVPFVGPSSIVLALMASGLSGQSFAFHGYLPKEKEHKKDVLRNLERIALKTHQTQIFMEAPYKNQSMFDDILSVCQNYTYLCVAFNIQGEDEMIETCSIAEWKKKKIFLGKKPCLFLINKI